MLYVRCKQPELDRKGLDGFNEDSHGEEGSLESVGSPESQDSMVLPIHGPVTVDLSLNHDFGGMLEPARPSLWESSLSPCLPHPQHGGSIYI